MLQVKYIVAQPFLYLPTIVTLNDLILHEDLEKDFPAQDICLEDLFCEECDYEYLKLTLNNLSKEEKYLISYYLLLLV